MCQDEGTAGNGHRRYNIVKRRPSIRVTTRMLCNSEREGLRLSLFKYSFSVTSRLQEEQVKN